MANLCIKSCTSEGGREQCRKASHLCVVWCLNLPFSVRHTVSVVAQLWEDESARDVSMCEWLVGVWCCERCGWSPGSARLGDASQRGAPVPVHAPDLRCQPGCQRRRESLSGRTSAPLAQTTDRREQAHSSHTGPCVAERKRCVTCECPVSVKLGTSGLVFEQCAVR